MPKTKSIKDEAAKYLDLLERQEDKEKDRKWISFKLEIIGKDKRYQKLSEAMHKIECSEDFVYEQVWQCLNWLVDEAPGNDLLIEDALSDTIDREVDIYTANLTKWLNQSASHVYYLTEVLEGDGIKDGFQLLALAQYRAIEEIWRGVLDLILE